MNTHTTPIPQAPEGYGWEFPMRKGQVLAVLEKADTHERVAAGVSPNIHDACFWALTRFHLNLQAQA